MKNVQNGDKMPKKLDVRAKIRLEAGVNHMFIQGMIDHARSPHF
jgi:hypothetical protein